MAPASRVLVLAGAIALATAPLHAQGLSNWSGGLTVNTPIGTFDSLATMGWGINVRSGIGDPETRWSGRLTLGFDYFKGKGPYSNIQFVGVGIDLVHRSAPSFYQFVGFISEQSKFTGTASASGFAAVRQTTDYGFTGGIGVNFTVKQTKLFAEFAATTIFTGNQASNWFPIRAGVRF